MKNIRSILGNVRRADIAFFRNGRIDITSRIVKALGMAPGDVVDIMTCDGEYWLYVSVHGSESCGRYEAQCTPTKPGSRNFRAWSRRLCNAIIGSDVHQQCVRFASGSVEEVNGHKAINIITRLNLARQ